MCDCALDFPFEGDTDNTGSKNRVTAEIDNVLTSATWTRPAVGSSSASSGNGSSNGEYRSVSDQGGRPGVLEVETLVSSAVVKMEPEGFEVLQAVHARAIGVVPLAAGPTGVPFYGDKHQRGNEKDGLAEKLREKSPIDPVANLLPARPVLCDERSDRGDGDCGSVAKRPQLGAAVSPIRFNLAEPHMLGLACFAIDASARLADISKLIASLCSPSMPAQNGSSTIVVSETNHNSTTNDFELQVSRPDISMALEGVEVSADIDDAGDISLSRDQVVAVQGRASSKISLEEEDGSYSNRANSSLRSSEEAPAETDEELSQVRGSRESEQDLDGLAPNQIFLNGSRSALPTDGELDSVPSDQGSGAQLLGEGSPSTASNTAKAPLPPAFLGTLVIDAVSVLLLKGSSNAGGGATAIEAPSDNMRVSRGHQEQSSARSDPLISGPPTFVRQEISEKDAHTLLPTADPYSPLALLEIENIGVGIDLPCQMPLTMSDRSSSSSIVSVTEKERADRQYRAEVAVRCVTFTDIGKSRRGSLTRLVGGGAVTDGAIASVEGSQMTADDGNTRILQRGWWRRRGNGDAHGHNEQILLRGCMCTVSNTISIEANLASGHLMLLPAPILDLLSFATDLNEAVAVHCQANDTGHGNDGVRDIIGSSLCGTPEREVRSCDDNFGSLTPPPSTLSSGAQCFETRIAEGHSQDNELLPASPLPCEVVSGRGGEGNNSDKSPSQRRSSVSELDADRPLNWRQLIRTLGGATLSDFLWLERITVSISAGDLQLWLPHVEGSPNGSPTAHRDTHNVEAIVSSCGHCRMVVSLAVSLLFDDVNLDEADGVDAATAGRIDPLDIKHASEENKIEQMDAGLMTDGSAIVNIEQDDGGGATGDTVNSATVNTCNQLCEISFGAQTVEVFVARPSINDFGTAVVPQALWGPRLDTGSVGRISEPAIDLSSQGETETKNCSFEVGSEQDGVPRVSFEERQASSDSKIPCAATTNSGDVVVEASGPIDQMEQDNHTDGDGTSDEEGSKNSRWFGSSKTEALILPFSVDLEHVLLIRPLFSPLVPASPLLSEMKVAMTAIDVVCFLDFPIAARIISSLGPLIGGVPSSAERLQACGSEAAQVRHNGGEGTETLRTSKDVLPKGKNDSAGNEIGALVKPVAQHLLSRLGENHAEEVLDDRKEVAAAEDTIPEDATVLDLAAMWACRVGVDSAGLRVTVINNFYRQNRPSVKVNVSE